MRDLHTDEIPQVGGSWLVLGVPSAVAGFATIKGLSYLGAERGTIAGAACGAMAGTMWGVAATAMGGRAPNASEFIDLAQTFALTTLVGGAIGYATDKLV